MALTCSLGVINNNLWAVPGKKEAVLPAGMKSQNETLQSGATLPAGLTHAGTAKALQASPPSYRDQTQTLAILRPQLVLSENRVT